MELRGHNISLKGKRVSLRPMTEGDWAVVAKWETDPEVLYWADTDQVTSRTLEEVQAIFCKVSQSAYCFVIELDGRPIGDGWLQEMNLKEILDKYPGKNCRRVDLVIGEKGLWGQGLGTDIIRTLTEFGFKEEKADLVFGIIGDYNARSRRAFEKAGFKQVMKIKEPPTSKAEYCDVMVSERPADS